ncbi:MAG: helix-turn-helix domain-containing protein [Planctomycetes bacterium]|nr:helix-turn-helix domain-containing protein [Planctomycetota bacterium]
MTNLEKLLGPKEVGEILGLKKSKVAQMLASGEIPALIVAAGQRRRTFRVKPSTLLQWMKRREINNN